MLDLLSYTYLKKEEETYILNYAKRKYTYINSLNNWDSNSYYYNNRTIYSNIQWYVVCNYKKKNCRISEKIQAQHTFCVVLSR